MRLEYQDYTVSESDQTTYKCKHTIDAFKTPSTAKTWVTAAQWVNIH